MRQTTVEELAWIHDSTLRDILYDFGQDARFIRLRMRCPADLGYAPWEGKDLVLVAIDVVMSQHVVWGVAGPRLSMQFVSGSLRLPKKALSVPGGWVSAFRAWKLLSLFTAVRRSS